MVEQALLFPDGEGGNKVLQKTSYNLISVFEVLSEKEVKILLKEIGEISQEISEVSPYERHNATFANTIIDLWEKHEEVFSIICKEGCESIKQVVDKINQLKKEIDLEINHFRLAGLIWHMRKFFHIEGNDNPLPINVINGVICPAFGCSKEEEKKIALGGAYQ